MTFSRVIAFAVAIVVADFAALTGCTFDTPPHLEAVCVASRKIPVVVSAGKSIVITFVQSCLKSEERCVVGRDYKGPETCESKFGPLVKKGVS